LAILYKMLEGSLNEANIIDYLSYKRPGFIN
jgi:hypothetical protein